MRASERQSASCRHARSAGNTRRRNATITIERHAHAMIGLRVVLIALGVALGLVLLSQGFIVVGGLILAMTIVRAVLVFRWRTRMSEHHARRQALRAHLQSRGF